MAIFGFRWNKRRDAQIDRLHESIVASAREPGLYGGSAFPDTVDGRFEALTLHVLLVLRRLRRLPPPAEEVAQELVDSVFSHLEVGMRETGVGDMGVPKKMKKLGRAFYDRTAKYESSLEANDPLALGQELARRLGRESGEVEGLTHYILAAEKRLGGQDFTAILAGPRFSGSTP